MTIIYRFRSMDYLIHEYSELEKQELALSSPRNLNDPLEGYQDVIWEGDEVLWENLFRNYLLNLLWAANTCALYNDETFEEMAIQPDLTPDDLPTDEYRHLFDSVCQSFFEERGFGTIPSSLASLPEPLKRKNLQLVLSTIHRSALASVLERLRTAEIIPETWPEVTSSVESDTIEEILDELSTAMTDDSVSERLEVMASHVLPFQSHTFLRSILQNGVEKLEIGHKKSIFLFDLFPSRYVTEICDSLIHTDWHSLSFAKDCTNPSMWAAYANEHQGAALMFHADRQSDESWGELNVKERTGSQSSGSTYEKMQAPLYAVDYESPPPQVNFFRFLGRLPLPKLMSAWHSTPNGETSSIVNEILEDEDSWRETLWNHFYSMARTKLGEWKHEEEIRMVLPDLLDSEGSLRKVTYDLSRLAGVVFGLRTSLEDRFEVMRILTESSQGSDSSPVEFYQMVFDGTSFRKVKIHI